MKCERCGHELDNDDLFCSKCGKAVFEEYMDEDDIWEFYKSDEELKAMKKEAVAAKDSGSEKSRRRRKRKQFRNIKGMCQIPGRMSRSMQNIGLMAAAAQSQQQTAIRLPMIVVQSR